MSASLAWPGDSHGRQVYKGRQRVADREEWKPEYAIDDHPFPQPGVRHGASFQGNDLIISFKELLV